MIHLKQIFSWRILAVIIAFTAIIILYLNQVAANRFIQDDAFTSLRYVKNFLNGEGLVFNPGERVEGYTNFLWVMLISSITFLTQLIISILSPVHFSNLVLDLNIFLPELTQILSISFGISVLIVTYLLSKKIIGEKANQNFIEIFSFIPVIALLNSTPFIYWSVSGMEVSLFTTLTLLSILLFLDSGSILCRRGFIIVSVLNSFLRPEGMIFFFLLIMNELSEHFILSENKSVVPRIKKALDKKTLKPILFYSVPVAFYIGFRLIYYGYPLPNTYYAKTEFTIQFLGRGLDYFLHFAISYLLYGLMFIPVLIQFVRGKVKREEIVLFFFALGWCSIVIIIGGDVLPIHRFFLPVLPIIYLISLLSLLNLVDELIPLRFNPAACALLLIAYLIICLSNFNRSREEMNEKRGYEIGLVFKMKVYAKFVKENQIKKEIKSQNEIKNKSNRKINVAMSTIGAFSFYADVHVIDLVGLTDEYIAHNPVETRGIDEELPLFWKERHYNAGYVLAEKPDYIIFPAGAKPSAFAECAIFVNQEFYKNYFTQIFKSNELGQMLPIFTRKENIRSNSAVCDNKFVKYYIEANNLFLNMLETKNEKLTPQIIYALDKMVKICPQRIGNAMTLKGMLFFHQKKNAEAKKYLSSGIDADSSNSLARFYLMNLFISERNEKEAYKIIPQIQKYSPFAIPNINTN